MRSEPDSSYHITTNYSEITCNVYAQPIDNLAKTYHLKQLVKRHNERVSSLKINGFRGLLRFPEVVTLLHRLLLTGGVWSVNAENAYLALYECRVSRVSFNVVFLSRSNDY